MKVNGTIDYIYDKNKVRIEFKGTKDSFLDLINTLFETDNELIKHEVQIHFFNIPLSDEELKILTK